MLTFLRAALPKRSDESGAVSVLILFLLVAALIVGGLGLDVGNAIQQRTQLQLAADTAAHAALYSRLRGVDTLNNGGPVSEAAAKNVAVSYAANNMPVSGYGTVLKPQDITFGRWNDQTRIFTAAAIPTNAVRVTTLRAQQNGNPMATHLLKLAGVNYFNLNSASVFATYLPGCLRQGIVAQNHVKLSTDNRFSRGYCLHSNGTMAMKNANTFQGPGAGVPGVIVSLPGGLSGISGNSDPLGSNPGLAEALRTDRYVIREVADLSSNIESLRSPTSKLQPEYIKSTTVHVVTIPKNKTLTAANFVSGSVNTMACTKGPGAVSIDTDTTLRNIVLVTDCEIMFKAGVVIDGSIIATTNTSATAFAAPSSMQIGKDDNCAPGGGSKMLTLGGANFAAKLSMDGSQIIAKKTISFAAQPDGIHGAAFISGENVETTSQGTFAVCPGDLPPDAMTPPYFRMVR